MRFQQYLLEFDKLLHSLTPLGKMLFALGLLGIAVGCGLFAVWLAGV